MGLHRKPTVLKTFPDDAQRSVATRVFWCIYVLDRRWSFGTSLSFALQDRDIDPELPEPVCVHESTLITLEVNMLTGTMCRGLSLNI